MRSRMMVAVLSLSLLVSAGSLLGSGAAASDNRSGCCVCLPGVGNATVSGFPGGATCVGAASEAECPAACGGGFTFENVSCSDPSLAAVCNEGGLMAPTASPVGLTALAALLCGFGAFYLRRRSA